MPRWYASVSFTSANPFTDDAAFETLDMLAEHSAAVSPRADQSGGEIALSVTAATVTQAVDEASTLVTATLHQTIGSVELTAIETSTEAALDAKLAEPIFPEVVGFSEIAAMAHVSRQRARQFTHIDGFPAPVITTAQGPLMTKAAVEQWLKHRNTRAGRRKSSASA